MRKTALLTVAFVLALSACTNGPSGSGSSWHSPGTATAGFTVTPADNAKDVPVSAEVALKGNAGSLSEVTLTDADGEKVDGDFRRDKSSWVPADPLKYSTSYTAAVTAKDKAGKTGTSTTKFTTMARAGNRLQAHLYMGDNATYGQAM